MKENVFINRLVKQSEPMPKENISTVLLLVGRHTCCCLLYRYCIYVQLHPTQLKYICHGVLRVALICFHSHYYYRLIRAHLDTPEPGNDELSLRIAVIRHHLKIEAAIADGSKNVVKMYEKDKKALQEVSIAAA